MTKSIKTEFFPFNTALEGNAIIFVDDSLTLGENTRKILGKSAQDIIAKAAALEHFKGQKKTVLNLIFPTGLPVDRLTIVGVGNEEDKKKLCIPAEWNALGGYAASQIKGSAVSLIADIDGVQTKPEMVAGIAAGVLLRSYRFDRYKTKKKDSEKKETFTALNVFADDCQGAKKAFKTEMHVVEGTNLARTLVNEPANVLYPEEFAKRASELKKLGVEIDILNEKDLKKEGLRALLAVGQGSRKESQVVVMRWNGGKESDTPIAFIGKGVCFDTGGISIKPAANMEDMKGDMAGAACVTGLMYALAARKAKVNVIGAIGLVENMPDGAAQRPGDIVTSLSGQTIEIINTDAEGRLVLADLLWYVQAQHQPKFMLNLATLTGAILVALGQDYAGLFSNDDMLSEQVQKAGNITGEQVWRMPLGTEHDKAIDSKFADMKNSAGRMAGSSTAAAFLQRHVNKVPWVHLDIAGTAMGSPQTDINDSWGSGWGVRLLDRLIRDNYEK